MNQLKLTPKVLGLNTKNKLSFQIQTKNDFNIIIIQLEII